MTTIPWIFRSLNIPLPNKETLSRHSFLGPNGLQGQWLGPTAKVKVNFQVCGFKKFIISDLVKLH